MEYDTRRRVFVLENDEGEELEVPTVMEVCGRCQGKGTHVNPAIDGQGITMEEWNGPDWDDDSREGYLTGRYDVTCYECHGNNVVPVPDWTHMSDELRALVDKWQCCEAHYRAEQEMERRMGA